MSVWILDNVIKNTINIMFTAVTTQEGLKTFAEVTKLACETIIKLQENSNSSSKVLSNIKERVTNMNNLFSLLEPVVISKEFILGDKEGKRPWVYLEKATLPKGLSWAFGRTGACLEFLKCLYEIRGIDISSLSHCDTAKSICDIGQAGFFIIDHSIFMYKTKRSMDRLEHKLIRQLHPQDRGERIRAKIENQYKNLKKSYIAIAFSVGALVLGILSLLNISSTGKLIVALITSIIGVIRFSSEVSVNFLSKGEPLYVSC